MPRLSTQISGIAHNKKLFKIQQELEALDITVTHPQDGLIFSQTPWEQYEQDIDLYEAIAHTSFHTIWSESGYITAELAQQILYAMTKQKPIVLTEKITFSPEVDAFARETILARIKMLQIVNLPELEAAELNFALKNMPAKIDYELSPHEAVLVSSRTKGHFRELLDSAQHLHVQYA